MTQDREQLAWGRLLEPTPRGRYEHIDAWEKRDRPRRNFVARVRREPGGCWEWTGMAPTRTQGKRYPILSIKVGGVSRQKSAFGWMIDRFFPELAATRPSRTSPTCGNDLCINPYHRANKAVTNNRITADQARQIYAAKGEEEAAAVAQRFGISRNQVLSIWRGRNWGPVTGAPRHRPQRQVYSDDVVLKVAALKGRASTRKAAAEVGVSTPFVRSVWSGRRQPKNPDLLPEQLPC